MSPQIPDRPPRRRTKPRWPALLLIAGITLTVAGFVLTVGPLALDSGGPTDDPADGGAGDGEVTDDTTVNGDGTTGAEDTDEAETTGISEAINTLFSGAGASEGADEDENREKCVAD